MGNGSTAGNNVVASERDETESGRPRAGGAHVEQGNERSDGREGAGTSRDLGPGTQDRDSSPSPRRPAKEIIQYVDYKIQLPTYHEKQEIFVNSKLKRKIIRAGRRSGKTTGVSGLSVERFCGPAGTNRVLYAVPTTDQLNRWWHEVVIALAEPLEFGVFKKYETDHIIEFPGTEQRLRGKTAWNANTMRGDYADLAILDEMQLMSEEALDDVILPMLIDNNGDLVLVYTPPSLRTRSISKAVDKRFAAKLFKKFENDPRWLCLHFTSYDNPFVSQEGILEVSGDMTELAVRQEIMAEDIEEVPGALWKLALFERNRVDEIPEEALPLERIVVGVDPTGSSTNEAGIVGAALGRNAHGYVLRDESLLAALPRNWAQAAVWLYWELQADRIIGETNYGGDMVEATIRTVDENVSYKNVVASRGKLVRAEPICALYEKDMIHHVGPAAKFDKLEDECCSYVPGDPRSPNRMDAMVWAMTELFPENRRLALVEQAKEEQAMRAKQSTLIKPVTGAKTERCSFCGKHSIVRRGPIKHCTACGKEEKPAGEAVEYDRQSRSDFFK